MHEKKNRFTEIYRIVDTVVKCRYLAQKRLLTHSWFSQITLTGLALGLVIIPLMSLGGFNRSFSPKYIEVMQIVFAVATMAYSLLLGIGNFAARAERMHSSGIKLSRLLRIIKPLKEQDSPQLDSTYESITSEYYGVLEGNENHSALDYNLTLLALRKKDGPPRFYDAAGKPLLRWQQYAVMFYLYHWQNFTLSVRATVQILISFGHYVFSLLAVFSWIALMCWNTGP